MRKLLTVPATNDRGPRFMEKALAAIHQALRHGVEQAALTRADLPEEERRDHSLYLDEFQTLTTPSTAIMLSESRKYRLCLTLSHQLTRQLNDASLSAVLGNCGTLIAFRVGSDDAALLAPTFSKYPGQLKPQDLTNLPNYTAYVRLLIDGTPSNPFSMSTLLSHSFRNVTSKLRISGDPSRESKVRNLRMYSNQL